MKKFLLVLAFILVLTGCGEKNSESNSDLNNNDTIKEEFTDGNFGGIIVAAKESDTHKGIVYMDPTNLKRVCNENNSVSKVGTTKGCMKFYIYDETEDTYKMILDHNTTSNVDWISYEDYIAAGGVESKNTTPKTDKGFITLDRQFAIDTENWIGNPRNITADEVAHIVGADREDTLKWSSLKEFYYYPTDLNKYSYLFYLDGQYSKAKNSYSKELGWLKQTATYEGASNYYWLYDNTYKCKEYGCKIEDNTLNNRRIAINGYWTSTITTGKDTLVWHVENTGSLWTSNPEHDDYGIRPVIEISKTLIK